MGRFGSLFKKSEKEKPESNPYAQQPAAQSPAQSSPPPQYDQYTQYNNSQYNDNQYATQRPQGQPSGLPTGPRPGGLPGRVAPGPGFGNDKPPPPQYSPQPSQYSAYSPSLGSAAGTPVLPSNTSSPSMGTGFPREKYGASDGVGKNRFEPAPSSYGNSAGPSSQQQGGYGNLGGTGSGGLFDNYNGPSKQTAGSVPGQAGAAYDPSMQYGESQAMTAEEREQAEVDDLKSQILAEQEATNQSGRRALAMATQANEQMEAISGHLLRNTEAFNQIERNANRTKAQADISGVNIDSLNAANTSMFNFVANSKARTAMREDKKMNIERQNEAQLEQVRQEEQDLARKWQAREQQLEAARPKVLLGATSKTESSKWEFEDDTGEQREKNEEHDEIVDQLTEASRQLRKGAEFHKFMLEQQNAQLDRITNKVETAGDAVTKQRVRLDTRYK